MKLIHTADMHLDSQMKSHLDSEKARERRAELVSTFEKLIEDAVREEVQGILLCGDIFDTVSPRVATMNVVLGAIRSHPEITFFYLRGNHDDKGFRDFIREIPENLVVFSNEWTTCDFFGVKITGAEFSARGTLPYNRLSLNPDDFNIVMLHGPVEDSMAKNGIIGLRELEHKNIDYLALGHIHSYTRNRLDERGIYSYAGCPEGRGFDECGPKSYTLLTIDPAEKTLTAERRYIAKRTCYEIPVDISDCGDSGDIRAKIRDGLDLAGVTADDMVRVVLRGDYRVENEKNLDLLDRMLADCVYFGRVEDASRDFIDYHTYEQDRTIHGEFVRRVQNSNFSEEDKEKIIRIGLAALRGDLGDEDI